MHMGHSIGRVAPGIYPSTNKNIRDVKAMRIMTNAFKFKYGQSTYLSRDLVDFYLLLFLVPSFPH